MSGAAGRPAPEGEPTLEDLRALASYRPARVFLTALRVGIFDALAGGPLASEETARELDLDPRATDVLLHALAALGVLRKEGDRFANGRVAQARLQRASPLWAGDGFLLEEAEWEVWGELDETLGSGRPSAAGREFAADPATASLLLRALRTKGLEEAPEVAAALDLREARTLLDVGGGHALYSVCLCRAHSGLRCTVFDLQDAIRVGRETVREYGLVRRIDFVAGDFLRDPLPGPFDAALLANVLHGFAADDALSILGAVRRILGPGRPLFLRERILDDDGIAPRENALFSVHLLLTTPGGRARTEGELRGLLREAGFPEVRSIPRLSILEAR